MLNKDYFNFGLKFDDLSFVTDLGYIYTIDVVFKQATKVISTYAYSITLE